MQAEDGLSRWHLHIASIIPFCFVALDSKRKKKLSHVCVPERVASVLVRLSQATLSASLARTASIKFPPSVATAQLATQRGGSSATGSSMPSYEHASRWLATLRSRFPGKVQCDPFRGLHGFHRWPMWLQGVNMLHFCNVYPQPFILLDLTHIYKASFRPLFSF